MGHFPPVSEKCHIWPWDIFLPFLKSVTNDHETFSSRFCKVSHMTMRHFPPISVKCHIWPWDVSSHFWKVSHMNVGHFPPISKKRRIWPWDIFLPYLKSVTFDFSGGKCPIVICDTFQKWEENVPWSYVTLYRNWRKMCHIHMWHFSEMGGKCPTFICDTFQKWEENVL